MTADELASKVDEVIARVGAKGPKDMGGVMKVLLPRSRAGPRGRP